MSNGQTKVTRTKLGPTSSVAQFANLDHRTSAGILVRKLRAQLVDYVGGNPSPVEEVMIHQACFLALRIAWMNQRLVAGDDFKGGTDNRYLAWCNSLTRILSRLERKSKQDRSIDPMAAIHAHLKQVS